MTTGDDERIQADLSDRLAAELPADAAQIQVDLTHPAERSLERISLK